MFALLNFYYKSARHVKQNKIPSMTQCWKNQLAHYTREENVMIKICACERA